MADSRGLFKMDDILDYTGMSKNKFYRLIKKGFPAWKLAGNWISNKDMVDAWAADPNGSFIDGFRCPLTSMCEARGVRGTDEPQLPGTP
jgi:hypothetical protein